MKRLRIIFGIILFVFLCSHSTVPPEGTGYQLKTVVIDAGHGGKDPGALGKHSKEKDIALSIALKLGKYIEENFKGVKVIYTRKTDVFIELYNRPKIANDNHADLFISIHCNSAGSSSPYGTESFVMGPSKNSASLAVAKKENSVILLEDDYKQNYEGFDPNSTEGHIIFSLYQNEYIEQSLKFAGKVQKQFTERVGRHDRGVKQDRFLVLWKTNMPSVLIETGFISNPEEEKFLMSEQGQDYLASAIFRAFRDYKNALEGKKTTSEKEPVTEKPVETQPEKETQKQDEPAQTESQTIEPKIYFSVQIALSKDKKDVKDPYFKGLDVWYYQQNGYFKYVTGKIISLDKAVELQKEAKQKGFDQAFVVAFNKGERISPKEAAKLIEESEN